MNDCMGARAHSLSFYAERLRVKERKKISLESGMVGEIKSKEN